MIGVPGKCLVWLCVLSIAIAPRYLAADEAKADSGTEADGTQEVAKPELDPQQEAQVRLFESILKVELSFLNRVVDLSDKQLAQAIKIGKSQVEEEVRKAPKNEGEQAQLIRGRLIVQNSPNLRVTIENALHKRFQELLDEDQQGKYASELEMRAKFEKQALVDSLVATFDAHLLLSAKQRSQITEKLMQASGETLPEIDTVVNYGQYLPTMDDQKILPFLNDDQRKILRGIQRVTFGTSHNLENYSPFLVDDIDIDQ